PRGPLPGPQDDPPSADRGSAALGASRRGTGAPRGNSPPQERTRTMKRIDKRLVIPIVVACAPSGARAARADAVTDWNAIMQATVADPPTNPNLQTRWGAIVQLAVFEAVNAIVGDYEPYLGTIAAPPWASPDAAAIAAAHRTLVALRPGSAGPPLNL